MVNHVHPPIRILHLEDSNRDAELVAHLVADQLRCEIIPAANRQQFELALEQPGFDVILCDYNLTDCDGLSALKLAKQKHPETPVIIVSGIIDADEAVQCLKGGATDYLLKQRLERLPSAILRSLEEAEEQRQRQRAEDAVRDLNANLERRVEERTAELEAALGKSQEAKTLLLRNDKLASLGRMCAGLIHEINNPLNYAAQGLFLLEQTSGNLPDASRGEFQETLDDVKEGVARVVRIVSDLRGFTRGTADPSQTFELKPLMDKLLLFFSHEFNGGVTIAVDVPDAITVCGDSNQLVQVLVNLVQNSLDAVRTKHFEAGVSPGISITANPTERQVAIKVRDNGPGIPHDLQGSIFDPFFTTKDVGAGMGLGLTICHRIMTEFGGEIDVRSKPGIFCEFSLKFPAVGPRIPAARFDGGLQGCCG